MSPRTAEVAGCVDLISCDFRGLGERPRLPSPRRGGAAIWLQILA
jgi:hypothetical protein